MATDTEFFTAALSAGAILTGFCGTFLSFRIQREANYYRQPVLDFKTRGAKDVPINLSHFSTGFLMLILASVTTMTFGLVLPVLRLAGLGERLINSRVVAAGLIASLVLICGYFCVEMLHYNILSNRLLHDRQEWGRRSAWAALWILGAIFAFMAVTVVPN
jgi:hypothetical protein